MSDGEYKELSQALAKLKPADIAAATEDWLMLKFGKNTKDFIASRMLNSVSKQPKSTKSRRPNSRQTQKPTLTSHEDTAPLKNNEGKRKSELEQLGRYRFISKTGRSIILTKLSRNFFNFEESRLHRNSSCEFIGECVDYAIDQKISCFSCINCGQKNDRSALY